MAIPHRAEDFGVPPEQEAVYTPAGPVYQAYQMLRWGMEGE